MTTAGNDQPPTPQNPGQTALLGLSTEALAGLSIDELTGNKTAITMLVHYYKVLLDQNTALKNDLNTAKSYVDGYNQQRSNTLVGAIMLLAANIGIGFGVNLLTSQVTMPGLATFIPAIVLAGAGTYISL